MPRAMKVRSAILRGLAIILLAVAAYGVSGWIAARGASHSDHGSRFALLALGDTGKRHRPVAVLTEGQVAVADAMVLEDRHHPVDAIVLLGDNFYMQGLQAFELVPRIRENLVLPYCHFFALAEARGAEVASACREPASDRHPIPIYALLGNHDLESPESARLQREVVPRFIANWRMDAGFAQAHELGEGLSLISFDSASLEYRDEERTALVDALRNAKGPWRILAAHSAMAIGEFASEPEEEDGSLAFERWVAGAIEEANAPVHLYLAGHHHSMQVVEGGGALGPALHVIVGTGSRWRSIQRPHPRRRFGMSRLGFARVDVVGRGDSERLIVSLLRAPTTPLSAWGPPKIVAQWSIDRSGVARDVLR